MYRWDFCRSVMSAQLLVALGEERGVSRQQLLHNSGVSEEKLYNPETVVEAQSELTIIRNLMRALPNNPELALHAGQRYQLSTYGIWGFAIASSPNARQAIELARNFQELTFVFAPFSISMDREKTTIVFDDEGIPQDVQRFCLERDMAAATLILGELLGQPDAIEQIRFRHGPPPYIAEYQRAFPGKLHFNAGSNLFEISNTVLDVPRIMGNASTANLLAKQCGELLSTRNARRGLSGKVRDLLLQQRSLQMDMEAVASALHMTSRTLRRKLDAEGSSFRQLSDEIRQTLAEELLRGTPLSIEQIAERLSYADGSSFSQAFKRMTNETPGSFRRRHQSR